VTFGCYGTLVEGCADSGAVRLFDDVEGMLAELRAKGFRLGVLTNGGDEAFEIAHRTFQRPFDLFVTSDRVRGHKPAPWHFRAFELMTHASRRDWVHVASSWHHDIEPARTFGVNRVWLDRKRNGGPASAGQVRVYSATEAASVVTGLFE